MKKAVLKAVKLAAEKALSNSANSTTSIHAYQPKAPEKLNSYKK